MDKLDPYSVDPTRFRLDDGTVVMAVHDATVTARIDQLADIMRSVLSALTGIRARLDAGVNTKTVTALGTVTV